MNSAEVKKRVKAFRREYGVREISAEILEAVFRKQGFTIIVFNPVINDSDITTVIDNLGLAEMITRGNGFLYVDSNYRLLFINEKLNEHEKQIILAHEQGHYYCGHVNTKPAVGRSVQEEYEANEFSHYLLQKGVGQIVADTSLRYKKQLIIGLIVLGLAIGTCAAAKNYRDRQLYEGEYYVTVHGEKYHRPSCVTIQGHETRRLTKEDVRSGEYEPCSVCQPDKWKNSILGE